MRKITSVAERIRLCRMAELINKDRAYSSRIGIESHSRIISEADEKVVDEKDTLKEVMR